MTTDYRTYPDFLEGYAEAERHYAELVATHTDDGYRIPGELWSNANLACISADRQQPASWKGLGKIQHLLDLCTRQADTLHRCYTTNGLFRQGISLIDRGTPYIDEGVAALRRLQTDFRDLEDDAWVAMYVLQAAQRLNDLDATKITAEEASQTLEDCVNRFLDWDSQEEPSERSLVREQVARVILDLGDLWQTRSDPEVANIIALYRRLIDTYEDETEEDTPFLVTHALLETALCLDRLSPPDNEGAAAIYETVSARYAAGTAQAAQGACALYRHGNLYVNQQPIRVAEAQDYYRRVIQIFGESRNEAVLVWVGLARNNLAALLEITGSAEEAAALFTVNITQFAGSNNEALRKIAQQAQAALAELKTPPGIKQVSPTPDSA